MSAPNLNHTHFICASPASFETTVPSKDVSALSSEADCYRWSHSTLFIRFLNGGTPHFERVIRVAREWQKHCCILFAFDMLPPEDRLRAEHDIRIEFTDGLCMSLIGSQAQTLSDQSKPTMWLPYDASDVAILHQFGHALGFIHTSSPTTGESSIMSHDFSSRKTSVNLFSLVNFLRYSAQCSQQPGISHYDQFIVATMYPFSVDKYLRFQATHYRSTPALSFPSPRRTDSKLATFLMRLIKWINIKRNC